MTPDLRPDMAQIPEPDAPDPDSLASRDAEVAALGWGVAAAALVLAIAVLALLGVAL